MDKINWPNYNDTDFTHFCNALLTFEFGKSFQGFSAPGKDGGIDGQFEGNYQGSSGKWRFQYKYRSGARIEGFRNLKSMVKSEMSAIKDEKFFVLLTNIELLPQEHHEFLDTLNEELSKLGKNCSCRIWDGTKLYNLYLQYPLLELWLLEGFTSAQLQQYRSVFKKNLDATGFTPGTLNNIFISRKDDLEKLEAFLLGKEPMALITGEAGIGKTRLVIEFFKTKVDALDDWSALVLLNRNVEFDKIRKALSGAKNYVILIDDAHTYKPEIISDIKALCEGASNKVKLILTARNLEAFNSLSLIKEYEKTSMPHFRLEALSRADTRELFLPYITGTIYENYVEQLLNISYGKPILIVAILNALQNNIAIGRLREQGFLKDYVSSYFGSYYQKVKDLLGWPELKTKKFLQHVVLIEPFTYNDTSAIQKLAGLNKTEISEAAAVLKLLSDDGFVDGRYTQSIKPDYYSDILLSEMDRSLVTDNINQLLPFLDNIIINLSSVDEICKDQSNVLEEILTAYCAFIKSSDDIDFIDRIIVTVIMIAGFKPVIAKTSINLYLEGLSDPQHIIRKTFESDKQYPAYSGNTTFSKVIDLLGFLLEHPEDYDFVLRKATKLFELTGDAKVANVYAMGRLDVIDKFTFKSQLFFVQEFDRKINKLSSVQTEFGLHVINLMLNLEFTMTGLDPVSRSGFIITTYFLPASSAVKKLRQNITGLLIKLYAASTDKKQKLEILKCLLDIPRSIFATHRNSKPYENNQEISLVLDFLEKQALDFDISEKQEVQDKLFWFTQWGIPTAFLPQLEEIGKRMQPKNLTEQLSQLFSKAELGILVRPRPESYIVEKCNEFVNAFSKKEMAKSIIDFLEPQPYPPTYFHSLINNLIHQHPEYAKELYQQLFQSSPVQFGMYGSILLGGAYYVFKDEDFYWSQVALLQKLDRPELDNVLLYVYGNRIPGGTTITEKDTAVILKIFNKKRPENNFNLASGLQSIIAAKHPETLQACRDFLSRAEQKPVEMFFIWLSDNKTATTELIADLVLGYTHRFYLTYEIERCLNLVLINVGINPVFNYLKQRYDYKKAIVIKKKTLMGYDFVPRHAHSHLFENCPENFKPQMFQRAVGWYTDLDGKGGHLFYARDLLEYLKPGESLDQQTFDWFATTILEKAEDTKGLDRILDALSIFHIKDDLLLELVIRSYTIAYDLQENDLEYFKLIRQNAYLAITTMGVKSGTAGQAFPVDLDLQQLLKTKTAQMSDYMPTRAFLLEVLKSVDAEIERSLDRDNLTW